MAKKPTQDTFDVFKQKQVRTIEKWADKFDETRDLISKLKLDLKNYKAKLKEAIHTNQDLLDRQENAKGEQLLVYVRGDYRVNLKTTEDVAVKIGSDSKQDAPPDVDPTDDDEADPELDVEVTR